MITKKKALDLATHIFRRGVELFGPEIGNTVLANLSEELIPVISQQTDYGTLRFYCPGRLPLWRARTLLTKEPETIRWINTFSQDDVLWDIGANVGTYTLVAALRGVRVCSFEPSPGNYFILSRNIELNGFDDIIDSLCIAFSDITGLDSFYMANTELGGALNAYGSAIDWKGDDMDTKYRQSMLGFSIDNFMELFNPAFPNHVKIDVDGIERKIIKGGSRTLSNEKVKSVLVELDIEHEETDRVVNFMSDMGLVLSERTHAPVFDSGPYSSVYNHIFVRDGHLDALQ